MEPEKEQPSQEPQKKPRPTAGELYQAWKDGGEAKLKEMLEQMPEEDDED